MRGCVPAYYSSMRGCERARPEAVWDGQDGVGVGYRRAPMEQRAHWQLSRWRSCGHTGAAVASEGGKDDLVPGEEQ